MAMAIKLKYTATPAIALWVSRRTNPERVAVR